MREAVKKLPRKRTFPANPAGAERKLEELDSNALYHEVENILKQVVRTEMTLPAWHKKLDEIALHPVWGMVILFAILFMVFQAVYTWAAPVMELIEGAFGSLGEWVGANMPEGVLNNLIVNGIIAGVGSVLVFLPQITILFALYVLGIASAALVAYIMKMLARRQGSVQQFPLLMELPTFRTPNFKHILTSLWDRVKAFLKRAGTIIFAVSVILWALVSWPAAPEGATGAAIDYSLAGTIGHFIQPLFAPLGFTWEMCIAMIPGIAAREVVVAALGTVYAVGGSEDEIANALIPIMHNRWGLPTAFAFLAWYIYAPMCAATLAVIKRETKSLKTTLLITGYLFALAYLAAFVVYQITSRIF